MFSEMKYYVEENLSSFKFWSGGKDRADMLTCEQLDAIERELEVLDEEWSDTRINDLFWFDFEYVCSLIGLKYTADGEVVNEEEWFREIIGEAYPEIWEIYIEGFTCENRGCANSKKEVLDLFAEYLSDNWLDHAEEVLEREFPEVDGELRSEFACNYWQNCGSDEYNLKEFEKYAKQC